MIKQAFGVRPQTPPFVLGVLLGGALGAGWVLARNYGRDRADQLFDWDQVMAVATATGARGPGFSDHTRRQLREDYQRTLRRVAEPLADYAGTGLDLADKEVHVLDRRDWIQANIANFRHLLQPLEDAWRSTVSPGRFDLPGVAALGRAALSAELGILLGYLARRVLGQYDITLLSPGPAEPGKLYFVEPNISGVQLQLGLPREEFRAWLTLHEAAHAHEFEGHPWIRGYLDDLLRQYLKSMVDQVIDGKASMLSGLGTALDRLVKGDTLIEAAMTASQRDLFFRLQALMTVLEGYSTHVMTAVGQHLIPHYELIEQRVEARQRRKGAAEILFLRLTGLQLKLEQYRLGTKFVATVEQERGRDFLHRVWDSPEALPTLDEIRTPQQWMQRMERMAA